MKSQVIENARLAPYTWFRVGGPADQLFIAHEEEALADFVRSQPKETPLMVIGVGSNLLVRDGGIRGAVIRLGAAFSKIEIDGLRVTAGAGALDASVAKRAASAGIAGLEFLRGIPGTIGGAIRMNAGAYGSETKDILISIDAMDRDGIRHTIRRNDIPYAYRHCGLPSDLIFLSATFEGHADDPACIEARMADIMAKREASQPVKEKTGGSTFKNPDPEASGGRGAWQMVDAVGGRGRIVGDAQMSPMHCNFMINRGEATAADLESLGESIRADVLDQTGVTLEWEIKRVGEAEAP